MLEHISSFLRRYPALETPEGAVNQCRIRTDDLIAHLQALGIPACGVWVKEPARLLPSAHPRAGVEGRHLIAQLPGGALVDVTRRQFEPDAPHPKCYPDETALAVDWSAIDDGPTDGGVSDERWRRL